MDRLGDIDGVAQEESSAGRVGMRGEPSDNGRSAGADGPPPTMGVANGSIVVAEERFTLRPSFFLGVGASLGASTAGEEAEEVGLSSSGARAWRRKEGGALLRDE